MAEKGVILSVDEEQKLLKPIDEYVGKIQKQIDSLRADGSDKVRSLKNHMAIVKENKNLTKEEKAKIIESDKKALEKAKAVESSNKNEVSKLIASITVKFQLVVKVKKQLKKQIMKKFVLN